MKRCKELTRSEVKRAKLTFSLAARETSSDRRAIDESVSLVVKSPGEGERGDLGVLDITMGLEVGSEERC